jgi:PIN domain
MDLSTYRLDRRPIVVADANVLFSNQQRNILVTLAQEGVIDLKGTSRIEDEWVNNVIDRYIDVDPDAVRRTVGLLRRALPYYAIDNAEDNELSLGLTDAKDQHVAAAAIACRPSILATWNIKDFDAKVLLAHDVAVLNPDALLVEVLKAQSIATFEAAAMAFSYTKLATWDVFLSKLARSLPRFVDALRRQ